MAETQQAEVEQTTPSETAETASKKSIGNFSFSIWPPSQRTRDAVLNRLVETLSSASVLSKRYGFISHEEASEAAKRIEDEAYAFAGASASADGDGIEILQVYSKEISRLMLDTVKSRSASSSAAGAADAQSPVPENKPDGVVTEEAGAVRNES